MKRILCLLPLLALVSCEGNREDRSKVLAKIAGTSYTQSDFEFMLKTMTPDRQAEIMKDPEARRKQFNFMLKQKLLSMAAQKSNYGKSAALASRQDLIDKRIITQTYFQTHLGENNGVPVSELQDYWKANPGKFSNDSGKVIPFEDVRTRVADSVVLAKAPIDSFYKASNRRYEQKAFCDLSLIQTKDKKSADEASKAVAAGLSFPDAVAKYSNHETSKANKGRIGRQVKGETVWELGGAVNADSLFFNDGTKLKVGALSRPVKKDSGWLVIRVDSCAPQSIPPLETVRKQVGEDWLAQFKSKISENALPALKAKYGVKLKSQDETITPAELQKFYEGHKDNYLSPETYDVYHVESKSKDQLVKRAKDVKDLEGFKKLASQFSENAWTKPAGGQIGVIKRDHCLPDGIGMMPALFTALDTVASGLVKDPLQNPDTKKWHLFWLVQKAPKKAKEYDRVKALVKQDYKSEKTNTIKPDDTLAYYPKKVLREKDVMFLREEIPPHMQDRYTREALVDYLLTWELATMEAKDLGMLDDVKMKAQREENKVNYWAQVYNDSIVTRTAGLDTVLLKKTFEANMPYFTKDSSDRDYHKYVRDAAAFLTIDPKDFDIEYKTNPERYRKDTTAMTFDESRYDIFQNLKGVAYNKADERLSERLQKEFNVVIEDPTLLPPKIKNPQDSYKQAQNLHYDRKLDVAVELYQRLRDEFPKLETLQDSICFGLAQIYIEQEKYQQALSEYRRLSYLYPKSSNNYKAMFMVGFIHAEHLKNDSAAVRAFEKMLVQYPSSDLSDDADWMIRNIRSGGKLMPVLEGDSGYVPPDSSAAGSSPAAKPAKAAAPAATKPAAKPAEAAKAAAPAKPDSAAKH